MGRSSRLALSVFGLVELAVACSPSNAEPYPDAPATTDTESRTDACADAELDALPDVTSPPLDAADDTVDAGTPAEPGLIAWYRFDETSGTTAANSGTAGKTIEGRIGAGVQMGVLGRNGTAFHFDGSPSSLVTVLDQGVNPLDLSSALTIELWVRPDAIDATTDILSKMADAEQGGFRFELFAPKYPEGGYGSSWFRMHFRFDNGGGSIGGGNGHPVSVATWFHLAVIATSSPDRFFKETYVNATYTGNTSCGAVVNTCPLLGTNDAPLTIGGRYSGSFAGTVDDIKIWNVVRTRAEICSDAGGTSSVSGCTL